MRPTKRILNKLADTKALNIVKKPLVQLVKDQISQSKGVIVYYDDPLREKVIDLIYQIQNENEMILGVNEAYQLFASVKNTTKIPGDVAEVGVYKGGSAKLICEAKGTKNLHLFDTFEGIPEVDKIDSQFYKGQLAASLEGVKKYLDGYKQVFFHKGLFPESAKGMDNQFSFVHLDVDTYKSTHASLEFFYERISRGGIILSHDYFYAFGVKKAFDEFFQNKPEPIIELSGSQCLVVKI